MITLMAIAYVVYIVTGFVVLDKIHNKIIWNSWADPAIFFGFIFYGILPFLIALDIHLEN